MPTLQDLIQKLDNPQELDIDQLKNDLTVLANDWTTQIEKLALYEREFQRELKAKVDLCGGFPACPTPEDAEILSGDALLCARREASKKFNQSYFMTPLSRGAQTTRSAERIPTQKREPFGRYQG